MFTESGKRKAEGGKPEVGGQRSEVEKNLHFLRSPISDLRPLTSDSGRLRSRLAACTLLFSLPLGFALLAAGCSQSTPSAVPAGDTDESPTIEVTRGANNTPAKPVPEGGTAPRGESFTAVVAPKPPPAADKAADIAELKRLGLTYDTDAHGRVTEINFNKKKVTPASLKLLTKFPALEVLILDKTGLTDQQLGQLKGLRNLKHLSLEENPITDAGLEHLKEMPGLTNLSLSKTKVTARGLKHIKGLTTLKTLNLAFCPVGDDSLANLTGMTDMITLTLQKSGVTGPGLKHVGKLTKLITLNLDDSKIAGQTLLHLKPCQKLRIIYMRNSTVSKRSIKRLEEEIESIAIFTSDDDD